MMSLEISAPTVEEAIQKALEQLGVSREKAEVIVVKEGKSGIFGLGAEEAVVRVRSLVMEPEERSEIVGVAREALENLLVRLGVEASVVPEAETPLEQGAEASEVITINVTGDDLGILIGRRGQTLAALQHVVRLIVAHQMKARVPIVIDVEGYKQRRYSALQTLARRMAEQVKEREKQFALEPMPAYERRIIHLTLADDPDVTTESTGVGEVRKVVIMPRPPEPD
ncbi:MAG: protein jag [Deltaproteobacteria bacterium]|nr:protein jag [Deltaproteobacteria bacterium]